MASSAFHCAQLRLALADQLNESRLRLEKRRERAAGDMITSVDLVRSADARIEAGRSRVTAGTEALRLVRDRLESGDAIQIEELSARRELAETELALVEAITSYHRARYLLHYHVNGFAWSSE